MPIDFPNSPTTNQVYSAAGKTWVYDGTTWNLRTGAVGAGSITSTELANDSVTSAKIAANTIVAGDIADYTITATKIANSAITNSQLAANVAATNLGFTPANAATAATTGKAIAMSIVFGG